MHLQHKSDHMTYWPTFRPHQCSDIRHQYTPARFIYWHDNGTCTSHCCCISMVPHCTSNCHAISHDMTAPYCPFSLHLYKIGPHILPDSMPIPTIPWYIPMSTCLFIHICTTISLAQLQLQHKPWIVCMGWHVGPGHPALPLVF